LCVKEVGELRKRPDREVKGYYEILFSEDSGFHLHQLGVYVFVSNDNKDRSFFNAQASYGDVLMHHQLLQSAARFHRSAFLIYLFAVFPL